MEFSDFLDMCGMIIIAAMCLGVGLALSVGIVVFFGEAATEVKELFRSSRK